MDPSSNGQGNGMSGSPEVQVEIKLCSEEKSS